MALLGDFGGFNDGIILLPAILMSIYSSKIYTRELFSHLPVKSKSNYNSKSMIAKKLNENRSPFELTQLDSEMLAEESRRIKLKRNSWCSSIFSCLKCLCKKDRGMLMQERAVENFERQLDIRSLVKTRIDLSILLSVLFSKE